MNELKQQLAPGWSPVNIGVCVILFMVAWPLALLMLAYIIWGNRFDLDLSRPQTLGHFAKRLGVAWRAALDSFSDSGRKP